MIKVIKSSLPLILLFLGFVQVSSANSTIGVVYQGNTEVNRETFMFFRKTINQTGLSASFTVVSPSSELSGNITGVIVLNTGRSSGIDPVLEQFISKNTGKAPIVLVNLFTGKQEVTVEVISKDEAPLGIDTISSASYWPKGGPGGRGGRMGTPNPNNPESLHLLWFKAALNVLFSSN